MIKEAINRILEIQKDALNPVITLDDGTGRIFFRSSMEPIRDAMPTPLFVDNLDAVVLYFKTTEELKEKEGIIVQVLNPMSVAVVGPLQGPHKDRPTYLKAVCSPPNIRAGQWHGITEFIIILQTCFKPTDERDNLIKLLSHISSEGSITSSDDGLTQEVTTKAGIRLKDVHVPNPVNLKPIRTFYEVDQPESPFLIRLQKNEGRGSLPIECCLFAADGGAWQRVAMDNIRNFFTGKIDTEAIF